MEFSLTRRADRYRVLVPLIRTWLRLGPPVPARLRLERPTSFTRPSSRG